MSMLKRTMAATALVLGVWSLGLPVLASPSGEKAEGDRQAHLRRILPMTSGALSMRIAERLEVDKLAGKALPTRYRTNKAVAPPTLVDVPVNNDPVEDTNEPSIGMNPRSPRTVVGFSHDLTQDPCQYYTSTDGGLTWSAPINAPLLQGSDFCSDPVVRTSPDGAWFYLMYMSIRSDVSSSDIVILRISGDLKKVDGPHIAMDGAPGDVLDKPWMDTHKFDMSAPGNVYASVTNFQGSGQCDIVFARSTDYALTWTPLDTLGESGGGCGSPNVLQGSHPAGGVGGNVLVCWYHSESDGWYPGGGGPLFDIRCRNSADRGDTFGKEVTAADNVLNEVGFWLCPDINYHRVWGAAMFPYVAIGPDGSAHVVFSSDPTLGEADGECGNVRYTSSAAAPYGTWTPLVDLGDSTNSFQGFATLSVQHPRSGGLGCYLALIYYDHVDAAPGDPDANLHFDVSRRTSNDCGVDWGPSIVVTGEPSLSDFIFVGDYIDAASAPRTGRIDLIWTDRRDKTDIMDLEDDVWSDRGAPPLAP
jgi:hypothetical protein